MRIFSLNRAVGVAREFVRVGLRLDFQIFGIDCQRTRRDGELVAVGHVQPISHWRTLLFLLHHRIRQFDRGAAGNGTGTRDDDRGDGVACEEAGTTRSDGIVRRRDFLPCPLLTSVITCVKALGRQTHLTTGDLQRTRLRLHGIVSEHNASVHHIDGVGACR